MPQYIRILAAAFVIVVTLFSYTQCLGPTSNTKKSTLKFNSTEQSTTASNPAPTTQDPIVQGGTASVDAFGQTLHPITVQRCATCHGSFQQPLHAVTNVQQAHDAIINAFKVNFSNPASSRMYLKLRDEAHNCWSDCNANATEVLNAINQWKSLLDDQNTNNNNNSNSNALTTQESMPIEDLISQSSAMPSGTIQLSIDTASLKAPMVKTQDGDIVSIWVPNNNVGVLANNNNTAGIGFLNFNTTMTGNYKMYGYVNAPTDSDNSFHVKVDSGNFVEWHIPVTSGFEWREVTHTSNLNPTNFFIPMGNGHLLEIRQREDGTKISKVIITDDVNFNIADINLNPKATITYDIAGIVGVPGSVFQVDVEIYDDYSYKISKPRITTNRSLLVKDIKLLINGQFNPQHATYTLVNMQIPAGTTQLSTRSLIALKDRGEAQDVFSFSFEQLEAR